MKSHPIRHLMCALCFWAVASGSVSAQQQESEGVSLGIATSQTGAPVGLRGYLASAGAFLYETATVQSLSERPISALTFGVLVVDTSNLQTRTLLRSASVATSIQPGQKQDVNVGLLPVSQLEDLRGSLSATPMVTLGVIAVEWADGTRWVFDLPEDATDFASGAGRIIQPNRQ